MRANRGRDTEPEIALRSALHARGLRFRRDLRIDLPGGRVRPDVVFTRCRVAVFVDGCYWHGCREHRSIPASNTAFWAAKIERTRQRDAEQARWLSDAGWSVLRFWEHDAVDDAAEQVADLVASRRRAPRGREA
jgi:DNA mismatch endonuclease (patch repair protein)